MRKNDLIKLLQDIKGNPEVLLWNGMVGDFMHIDKPVEGDLVKMQKKYYLESLANEERIDRKDWSYNPSAQDIKKWEGYYRKNETWQHHPWVCQEDIDAKRYKSKRVLYLQAKLRGVTTYDRLGGMSY